LTNYVIGNGCGCIRWDNLQGWFWIGQKVRDYVYSKKTPIPSKLKNGDKVKTPDTHPEEWKKGDT